MKRFEKASKDGTLGRLGDRSCTVPVPLYNKLTTPYCINRVQKLTALATSVKKSKLVVRAPLHTWVDASGRVALLGDSCHAMLVSNLPNTLSTKCLYVFSPTSLKVLLWL